MGHEFLGEVVEVGPAVRRHKVGDRVVVCSFVGCGRCWYCTHDLWSLCDNTNTNPGIGQALFVPTPAASSATPTPWAGCAAAMPSTCACPSPTTGPSPYRRASTTRAPCSCPTRCPRAGWAPIWPG
nr:alcohol dehydrogenase catalytic domain-containing protein [Streptomyces sp. Ru72]